MVVDKQNKLPPSKAPEAEQMATIACVWCGETREFFYRTPSVGVALSRTKDKLHGVLVCGGCEGLTVFGMTQETIDFFPGKLFYGDLASNVPKGVSGLLSEAVLCFYGTAFRAAVGMCRSCVEEALEDKGVKGRDLNERIENAPFLGDQEKMLAHGARLIGRNALHRMMPVSQSQAMNAITGTIDLVNYIARQKPVPASQSKKGSNAE